MQPYEIEATSIEEACIAEEERCVAKIEAFAKVVRPMVDAEVRTDIAASAAARHGVKYIGGTEKEHQVFDEIATAIAGVTAVAVFGTSGIKMIEAGEMRDGTGIFWGPQEAVRIRGQHPRGEFAERRHAVPSNPCKTN